MRRYRNILVALLDVAILLVTDWLALAIRFDFSFASFPPEYIATSSRFLPFQILITLGIFVLLRMYRFVWHFITAADVARMALAVTAAFAVCTTLQALTMYRLPVSVYCIMLLLQLALFCAMRSFFRIVDLLPRLRRRPGAPERMMIIGAGAAGSVLLRELAHSRELQGNPRCIIDDNPNKKNGFLGGVPIVGGREMIPEAVKEHRISTIIFAIPSARFADRQDILTICARTGCRVLVMPSVGEMLDSGEPRVEKLQPLELEDLLGRDPVQLDTTAIRAFLRGKTVLVTGGGGSIGAELCRQIARYEPGKLIILDIYENNAYDIQQELRRTWGDALDLAVEIASVRDKARIYHIFEEYRPQIVFHAAAHKHVPLMEANPEEAVKNNIFGTYHAVRAAERFGTEKFVMISTDKAVNPTSVMGASKRFCEMILQSRRRSATEFCSVRFGNVLGSNGSVVPLFEKQIAAGGPVTVTDKRITRFFMTIPEAVQLVMEAGAIAGQNQIFVLDMGQPVTILSLAENMIRLHGLEPYKDIDIVEIGLRPGEKLYEELLMQSEKLTMMRNSKIFVEEQEDIDPEAILAALEELDRAVSEEWDAERVAALLRELVPTFRTPEEINAAEPAAIKKTEPLS